MYSFKNTRFQAGSRLMVKSKQFFANAAAMAVVSIVSLSMANCGNTPSEPQTPAYSDSAVVPEVAPTEVVEKNDVREKAQDAANKLSEYVKITNDLLENSEDAPEDYSVGPFGVEGRYLTCEMFWFHEYLDSKEEYAETCMDWASRLDQTNKMLRAAYHAGYSFKIYVEINEPHEMKELTFDNSIFEKVLPESEHKGR